MKKFDDIGVNDHIRIKWIDLYPQDDTGDDEGLQLLFPSLHICMVDWFNEEFNFWLTDIRISPVEANYVEDKDVKKGFNMFTQTGLVTYYISRMKNQYKSTPCFSDKFHPLALFYAYQYSKQC